MEVDRFAAGQRTDALAAALSAIPPAVVLFGPGGRPLWCNRSLEQLLSGGSQGGRPMALEQALGTTLDHEGTLRTALQDATTGRSTRIDRVMLTTASGTLEREGWVGPVPLEDEPPHELAMLVFPAEEERLHPLLANTYDIISVLGADGTIRYSNPAAGRLMSYDGHVLAGSNAVELVHPDDQHLVVAALADLDTLGADPLRLRLRFGDGEWHHCLVHAADLTSDPSVGGIVVTVHDITEQVEAHEEVQRSEHWVRRLLDQLTDVVVVYSIDGEMLYVSPSIEKLVGTPEERQPGTEAFNTVHPEDLPAVEATYGALIAEPDVERRVTFRLRHEDGHYLWVEALGVNAIDDPAVGGIISTLRDITQLKQAEEMATGLVAAAPDAMVVVDDDGAVLLANDRVEALFGWSADDLVGRSVESLIPEELRSRHQGHRAAYAADPRGRTMGAGIELVAQRSDGTLVPVEVSLSTHDTHQGRLTSAAIRDITMQRETRRAMEAALQGEQEVVQRLREADELKAEFVSTVAHELKGPLSVISGFARMIERLVPTDEGALDDIPMMASRISANTDRLLDLIDQLLRFSRLEAGRAQLDEQPVELGVVVGRSVDLLQEALDQHRLEITVPDALVVWADVDGLANVVRNLLTNAAKFGPPGSVIWIEAIPSVEGVTVTVSDEGPGVDPEERDLVFDQFHQTSSGRAKGGSGLGLSIARRYVELHGGRIWVDQRPGAGARFSFFLPHPPERSSAVPAD